MAQEHQATATLSSESLALYSHAMAQLKKEATALLSDADKATGREAQVKILRELLLRVERHGRLALVYGLLGGKEPASLSVRGSAIKARIRSLEQAADTLDYGLKHLASRIHAKPVYIYPPTTGLSREITPFASAVKDRLSTHLKTRYLPEQARYSLVGRYLRLESGIELTYHLMEGNKTLGTYMAWFLPSAYKGYSTEPVSQDFGRLIASGMVVSDTFRVDVKTEHGRNGLLYKKGETVKLLVKLNRPGYFYMVSHCFKERDYSYVVELSEGQGNRKFISYIGPDEAGKWVMLGEFECVAPFGVETLQVFASTQDLEGRVPKTDLDANTQLYKVGGKAQGLALPQEALATTRGLMLKKRKKAAFAEASLTLTTLSH
ncbi:MAG: DUF4384 domain-containing protein, partial [Desulfobacterales bacterium]|nr:DUF4384 domain-containing protein [Desulfobacterales bacterium]